METKELMIGDFVLYKSNPIMVWEIDEYYNRINTEPDGYNAITCVEISDIKPIPLTNEILEQNGFELQRDKSEFGTLDTYWLGSELGAFRIHRLNNGDYQFGLAKIRNVHELQHALRLCKINKEIKL